MDMDRLSVNETAIDRLEINLQQDCFESSCIFAHLRLTGKRKILSSIVVDSVNGPIKFGKMISLEYRRQ